MLVEDLRQGRHRHLGTQQTDYPARWDCPTTSRAAARSQLQRGTCTAPTAYPIPHGARPPAGALARGAGPAKSLGTPGQHPEPQARRDWQQVRGMGGFVRSSWDEVNQIIAAANVYTIKQHGPDRVIGFRPSRP